MRGLSLRQPWAWAIMHAGKVVENRKWPTKFRGEFLIHAAKGIKRAEYDLAVGWMVARQVANPPLSLAGHPISLSLATPGRVAIPEFEELQRGGIIGGARLVDLLSPSKLAPRHPWHMADQYGFLLEDVRVCRELVPLTGMLGFFTVPDDIVTQSLSQMEVRS